jgi:hypothetical protein
MSRTKTITLRFAGHGLRAALLTIGTLCAYGGLQAQGSTPPDLAAPPAADPRAQPGPGLGVSGGAIAPGSDGTRAASAPPPAGGASRPHPDARPGDSTTSGTRRGVGPVNQPMADPDGRTRRPGSTGLEPGSATQRVPGAVGSGTPAGEANGGGGTIGQPATGAGTLHLRPRKPAPGASAP